MPGWAAFLLVVAILIIIDLIGDLRLEAKRERWKRHEAERDYRLLQLQRDAERAKGER